MRSVIEASGADVKLLPHSKEEHKAAVYGRQSPCVSSVSTMPVTATDTPSAPGVVVPRMPEVTAFRTF